MKVKKIITTTQECNLEIIGATLLSEEEAEELPIRLREYESCWWLQSPDNYQFYSAAIYNGMVDYIGERVDFKRYCVRPALKIANLDSANLQIGDKFLFGERIFEIISENIAFCTTDIGQCAFSKDWETEGTNRYEASDIKKYVDTWFDEVCYDIWLEGACYEGVDCKD